MIMVSPYLALGAGCYWGTEKFIVKDFQKLYPNSIEKAAVGFMSPNLKAMSNPSYRQVCSGQTGHVEVLYVQLAAANNAADQDTTENDAAVASSADVYEALIRFFFQFHDPTTMNRQGADVGTQYASVIFCADEEQIQIAQKVKAELQALCDAGKVKYAGNKVVTQITRMNPFYPAHEEHQQYLEKNPSGYCNHYYRFQGDWPLLN